MTIAKRQIFYRVLIVLLLAVVTLLSYSGVFGNKFISYDDTGYVTRNAMVQKGLTIETLRWAFTTTTEANWHPLTWLSHAFDCTLFGLNPVYHHAMNLFLHIISTLLLFLTFERMTKNRWQSAFVACVFALHPLHVESVAWVAERKDILSGLFGILTIGAYSLYKEKGTKSWYGITLLAYILGLLAKPMLVTIPFILILLDFWPLRSISFTKGNSVFLSQLLRSLGQKTPFFLLSALSSIVTYIVQQASGAMAQSSALPFVDRVPNAIIAYSEYLRKTVLPTDLAFFYPHPGSGYSVIHITVSLVILIALTIFIWRNRNDSPYLLIGLLWFLGMLVPVIGLVQVGLQSMADRYTYLPMIGVSIMVGWGFSDIVQRLKISGHIVGGIFIVLVILMGITTHTTVSYWKNSTTLYEQALRVTTDNHIARANLGVELADSGRYTESILHLKEALRIRPNEISIQSNLAKSLATLGFYDEALQHYTWLVSNVSPSPLLELRIADVLSQLGRPQEAISHFRASIQLDPLNPSPYCQLAELYAQLGIFDTATALCESTLAFSPNYSDAHRVLGIVAGREGNNQVAREKFFLALRYDSTNADAYYDLGILFQREGNRQNAILMYNTALEYNPRLADAHLKLGTALAEEQRLSEAEYHWKQMLDLNPTADKARLNLGRLYWIRGNDAEALLQLTECIRLNPENVPAHYLCGMVYERLNRLQEAKGQYTEALKIEPAFQPARAALHALESGIQ